MSSLRLVSQVILFLAPLGILLLLAAPKIRVAIGPVSARGQLLMTLVLFVVMIVAGIGEFLTQQRFHGYSAVMMLGVAVIVAARVISYYKTGHKS